MDFPQGKLYIAFKDGDRFIIRPNNEDLDESHHVTLEHYKRNLRERVKEWKRFEEKVSSDQAFRSFEDIGVAIPPEGRPDAPRRPYSDDAASAKAGTPAPQGERAADADADLLAVAATPPSAPLKPKPLPDAVAHGGPNARLDRLIGSNQRERVRIRISNMLSSAATPEGARVQKFVQGFRKGYRTYERCTKAYASFIATTRNLIIHNWQDTLVSLYSADKDDAAEQISIIIGQEIETAVLEPLFPYVFALAKERYAELDNELRDQSFTLCCLDPVFFNVDEKYDTPSKYALASGRLACLTHVHEHHSSDREKCAATIRTPTQILNVILEVVEAINTVATSAETAAGRRALAKGETVVLGADDFNPILEYVMTHPMVEGIASVFGYASDFADPLIKNSLGGYYFLTVNILLQSLIGRAKDMERLGAGGKA